MTFWDERLRRHGVGAGLRERFGEDVLTFTDPDRLPVEIVAVAADGRRGWTGAAVPAAQALRGLHTAELTVQAAAPTERLIAGEMAYRLVKREGDRARFETGAGGSGTYIDVIVETVARSGLGGVGTIHHVAWSVSESADQLLMRERLANAGYHVSEVRDRSYFHSIYYRERGGILFEIATTAPGFSVDEPVAALGSALKLPPQFESRRGEIERSLPPIRPAERMG